MCRISDGKHGKNFYKGIYTLINKNEIKVHAAEILRPTFEDAIDSLDKTIIPWQKIALPSEVKSLLKIKFTKSSRRNILQMSHST